MTELSCLLVAQVAVANVAGHFVKLIPHIGDDLEERSASGTGSTEDEELYTDVSCGPVHQHQGISERTISPGRT